MPTSEDDEERNGDDQDTEERSDESAPLSDITEDVARRQEASAGDTDVADDVSSDTDDIDGEDVIDASGGTPLSELREDIEDRKEAAADADGDSLDPFHEERVGAVDSEAIWADLLMAEDGAEGEIDPAATGADRRGAYQVVSKTLCHRCEYFGEPPRLHCTHEGTTIDEVVDMDHYRVTNCPMVKGGREIEETDS